jgi:hypothetical protein
MKLSSVKFISPVNGPWGMINSASNKAPAGRVGATAQDINLDEKMRFVEIIGSPNGKTISVIVPMTNVSCFVPLDEPAVEAKKAGGK